MWSGGEYSFRAAEATLWYNSATRVTWELWKIHSLQQKWKFHASDRKYSPMPSAETPLEDINMSWAVLLLWAGHLSFFDHAAVTNTKMSEYAEVSSFWMKSSCLRLHKGLLWYFLNNNVLQENLRHHFLKLCLPKEGRHAAPNVRSIKNLIQLKIITKAGQPAVSKMSCLTFHLKINCRTCSWT